MKCLWCGEEINGYFCKGGGTTIGPVTTGKQNVTKSFCYNDFLTLYKMTLKLKFSLTSEENFYMLHKPDIQNWYKQIPLVFENGTVKDGQKKEGC